MQVHMHISPDIPDGAPFAHMNPGNGEPFGVISFGGGTYFSVKDDAEAERVMEVAQQLIAMRQMIGIPHAFKSAGPGSVASPGWCTECGMLGDSPDHAEPASPEAVAVLAASIADGTPLLVTDEPEYPAVGSAIPPESNGGQSGYRVGECGHRVAGSEWRAGFRRCEHCGPDLGDDEREYCPECGADEDAGEGHADKCTIGDEAPASVTA